MTRYSVHRRVKTPRNTLAYPANGLVVSEIYNVGNTLTNLGGGEQNFRSTQFGVYGDVRFGYKEWAFLHFTGRNDWRSELAASNRSFFYPNVDASVILSDAIPSIKASGFVDELKVRGGWSKVGNVNIGPYQLATTFSQTYGYPYSSGGGFSLGNQLVAANLEPEMTTSVEAGFDLYLTKLEAMMGLTIYKSNTVDQTLPVQLPSSSGFSTLLTNVGEVENKGIETYAQFTPISTASGLKVTLRANYTLAKNEVISLSDDSDIMILPGAVGNARIVAKVGEAFHTCRLQNITAQQMAKSSLTPSQVTLLQTVLTTT